MVILYLIGYYGSGKHAVSVFSNSSSGVGGGVARGNFASDDGYFLLPIFSSSSTKNNKLKFKQMNAPAGASSRAEYSVKGSSASFGGVFGRISRLLQSPVLAPIALYVRKLVGLVRVKSRIVFRRGRMSRTVLGLLMAVMVLCLFWYVVGSGGSTVEPGTRVEAGMNANANANINIGQGTGGNVSVDMDTGAITDSSKESSGLALVLFGFMYKFLAIPIMITSKTLQIHSNYVLKTTGQLALFTLLANFLGTLARFVTVLFDPAIRSTDIVVGAFLVALVNGVLVFQLFYYSPPNYARLFRRYKQID